jgi:hypothetical protein
MPRGVGTALKGEAGVTDTDTKIEAKTADPIHPRSALATRCM